MYVEVIDNVSIIVNSICSLYWSSQSARKQILKFVCQQCGHFREQLIKLPATTYSLKSSRDRY